MGGLIEKHPYHNRDWYERIRELHSSFSWQYMGPVFVTPVKGWRRNGRNRGDELPGSPTASFSVVNGLHCSLAAMVRILDGHEVYQPVEAVLVLPRVDY